MKKYNVCEATSGCPFGKKDGKPQVCYAAEVCSGFTGKEKIKKEKNETQIQPERRGRQ